MGHLDTLYRGALRLTRDPAQAEDLVQDTYVRALRYQHSYQEGTNMKAWLFAIMRNLFWDRFKGRWLRGTEFHYPERPANLPSLKPLQNWPKFNPRDTR